MSGITTHVLDTAQGRPAAGIHVTLESSDWARTVGEAITDQDGRVSDLLKEPLQPGTYCLRFDTGSYYGASGIACFHPTVEIAFMVRDASQHYHVPLLLSPFGYTTYRGS